MSLSTEQMLRHIVEMQVELNEKTVPGWLDKGLDWDAAILTEVAEAIDSTDWKWWKHTETDLDNLKVEAVDLLHFLVAQTVEQAWHTSSLDAYVDKAAIWISNAHSLSLEDRPLDYVWHLKSIVRNTLNTSPASALYHLFMLFSALDMVVEDIYKAYITKNLLNHYRQERGYKDPAANYKKIIDGREDNVVFADAVSRALAFCKGYTDSELATTDISDIKGLDHEETERLGEALLANTSFKINLNLKDDSPSIKEIKELAFNLMDEAVQAAH